MIKFGVMGNSHPAPGADLTRLADDMIAEAQQAERYGFDSFFTTEHHQEPGYFPSPLPLLAAIAARTSTIRLGTGIVVLPLYHPTRLAEDCAIIDIVSKGRLILGVGMGYQEGDFAALRGRHRDHQASLDGGEDLLRRQASHHHERGHQPAARPEAPSADLGRRPRRRGHEAGRAPR
jgi:alkanesulfonate monooxygenase SsuD/methylene tetrahydromethanopterin reductase-like flavin-dependent oxidoreductase (luciferase family)